MSIVSSYWLNLSPERQITDRSMAIMFAADEIDGIVALAETPPHLAPFALFAEGVHELARKLLPHLQLDHAAIPARDPELEEVLTKLDGELARSAQLRGRELDLWREQVEKETAPYALALYYEIRRLDRLRIRGASFMLDTGEHVED